MGEATFRQVAALEHASDDELEQPLASEWGRGCASSCGKVRLAEVGLETGSLNTAAAPRSTAYQLSSLPPVAACVCLRRLAAAALLAERERLAAVLPHIQECLHLWASARRGLPDQQVGRRYCTGCTGVPMPPASRQLWFGSTINSWAAAPAMLPSKQAAQRAPHAHQVVRPGVPQNQAGQRGAEPGPPDAAQLHRLHEQRNA